MIVCKLKKIHLAPETLWGFCYPSIENCHCVDGFYLYGYNGKRNAMMIAGKESVENMEAKYISPFTDFGFKKLFGEEGNKMLLISFLNSLLPINSKIVDLTFKKNEQLGEDLYSRSAVFDVFCEDETGNQFIVEMQNARQMYYRDRAVFYSTFPIRDPGCMGEQQTLFATSQAKKGKWNFKLKDVYCI
jgi:hypothetical protein